VPFWLKHSRLVVRRLPGVGFYQRAATVMENSAPLVGFAASPGHSSIIRPPVAQNPSPLEEMQTNNAATFLSVSLLSSACQHREPSWWGRHLPPDPTVRVSTPSAGRPTGHSRHLPGTFNPGTLLSFCLQGLAPPRDPLPVSGPDPPLPLATARPEGLAGPGFEGLLPLGIGPPP
jgi:hypothetical protein